MRAEQKRAGFRYPLNNMSPKNVQRSSGKEGSLSVMRPFLPTAEELLPYLRRIDASGVYSNFGPLHSDFAERLADYFDVAYDQVALFGNGTLALQAAVATVGERGETWVAPSWTFVATGQAIQSAGRRVHFVDVERETWAITPRPHPFASGRVITAPFGARPAVEAWTEQSGIKVFDAASCFDSVAGLGPLLDDYSIVMVSLHATKTLGVGEGAVLFGPRDWIADARRWANFGFAGTRIAAGPGLNAKFSEYQAAVGLAALARWPHTRSMWLERMAAAVQLCNEAGIEVQPSFREGYVTPTWNVVLPENVELTAFDEAMRDAKLEVRRWWPAGVAEMPAFADCSRDILSETDRLANSVVGLPFGLHVSIIDLNEIVHRVHELIENNWYENQRGEKT